jgi:oxygen-independent coproporphyrinogen-3 oxidase
VEGPYVDALLVEWKRYLDMLGGTPVVREIHLGGGTPTFFSTDNLHHLVTAILRDVYRDDDFSGSFEGHPNNTTAAHLKVLYDAGFRRVSFGVQDLDLKVQKAIHRIQPFDNLVTVTEQARATGYSSVSFDLVYGLPFQTVTSISRTVERVLALRPDRLAFYSYAHVPWLRPGQRGYSEKDLPQGTLKRELYERGKSMLLKEGYTNIGMDHFALPHDDLFSAHVHGKLHRNFMGYTTSESDLLIGLGASAISDAFYGYAQNEKRVESYLRAIRENGLAVIKGHVLTEDELCRRACILQLSCRGSLAPELMEKVIDADIEGKLSVMEEDVLIKLSPEVGLLVTDTGRPFLRNICSVFDQYFGKTGNQPMYSKSI